ncbi:MAG TPA: enoyl-CoA hydratase-related protein [Mycobacteriales bacterium]|nr:enoyl-CoA hydratase-related protein [Mycobacteriales bacterium]
MNEVLVERGDGVLRISINREDKRNALSAAVLTGLLQALAAPAEERVVVVGSVGDGAFCSGADLAIMADDATGLEQHEARGMLRQVVLAMRACPVPVVARVQGLCLAGGTALAMGADVVLASSAAQFGLPEVNLGLWPFMVSALLVRHVAPKHAMDLMLTGERIDAAAAQRIGMVSRVFPAESFVAEVDGYVAGIAAKPPLAVRLGKAAFAAAGESSLEAALEAMQAQLSLLTTTHDVAEGIAAFFGKRPPVWQSR